MLTASYTKINWKLNKARAQNSACLISLTKQLIQWTAKILRASLSRHSIQLHSGLPLLGEMGPLWLYRCSTNMSSLGRGVGAKWTWCYFTMLSSSSLGKCPVISKPQMAHLRQDGETCRKSPQPQYPCRLRVTQREESPANQVNATAPLSPLSLLLPISAPWRRLYNER